jgi:hypothetical protein
MGGITPRETSVYIVAAGTNGSALTAADKVSGEITNITITGGALDVETIPVIGGYVDKEMPRDQLEISMDVIVQNTVASTLDRYDIYKFGTAGTSATDGSDKAIFLSALTNSNTLWKTWAFNNCNVVTWEPELAADDMWRGTITFKLSPQTALGSANVKSSALSYSTNFFNW